jgi:hypothetical protein
MTDKSAGITNAPRDLQLKSLKTKMRRESRKSHEKYLGNEIVKLIELAKDKDKRKTLWNVILGRAKQTFNAAAKCIELQNDDGSFTAGAPAAYEKFRCEYDKLGDDVPYHLEAHTTLTREPVDARPTNELNVLLCTTGPQIIESMSTKH